MAENQATGNPLTRAVTFNWIWSAATSSASTDNAVVCIFVVEVVIVQI